MTQVINISLHIYFLNRGFYYLKDIIIPIKICFELELLDIIYKFYVLLNYSNE